MRRMILGGLMGLALLAALAGVGAARLVSTPPMPASAASETDIYSHLEVGVTMVKIARGHRTIFTWDMQGSVHVFDLDDPGGATYTVGLVDNTFEGFLQFMSEQ